ncbi:MAG: sialidase family protein [Pirellulales bacterium]
MRLILFILCGYHLCYIGAAQAQSPEEYGVTTLSPPALKLDPGPKYWPRIRLWQGIPSIERTAKGRLWATWYCGPLIEGTNGDGNYAVLVTSNDDGKTWSRPVAVYDATPFFGGNTLDPHLWIDPQGRMWWFVNRVLKVKDADGTLSVWGFCTENPDRDSPKWNAPVFAGYGSALNKPTVLSNGVWLRPVDSFDRNDPERTKFYVSRDQGKSFSFLTKTPIENGSFSEHMVVERKDGSLFALSRALYGIAQIESFDHGATWKNDKPFTKERGVNARFHLRRLKSGALLLVVNDDAKTRTNMTAMLSEDEGKTWPHKLLLDDRALVSYPDGVEGSNGFLYIVYDYGRYVKGEQEILFAKITEADIKAGKLVNRDSRLRQSINRLADHGGGVHVTNETKKMLAENEKSSGHVKPKK